MDNDIKNITKMYDKLTYFDQYGASFILFIIITIVLVLLVSYFYTLINIQPIIDDWPNQRCKPNIIPFAGLITHPEGISSSDYTFQNFNFCTQNILSNMTGFAVQPLTYVTNILQSISNLIKESIQNNRAMFDKVRTSMQNISEEIMGRIMNIMIPLQQIIITFRDLIAKIQGTMTAGLFTLLGTYYTLKALMGAIAQFIITILITLAVMIAAFWSFPFTWGAAIANTAIFVAISIPMSIILAFMVDVLKVKTSLKIPKVKCFDKNTLIKMNDNSHKKIIDITVGDKLHSNNEVTSKIIVATEGSQMYYLNGILVSDTHIVKYKNNWVPVSQHPSSIKYAFYDEKFYDEKYLYCLNTSNKVIEINDIILTDWDEIYDTKLTNIANNIPTKDFTNIHKYLDYGFNENTLIKLKNGLIYKINEIKIDDILENGEKVYGLVEINGYNLNEQNRYILGDNSYLEGFNLINNLDNKENIKQIVKLNTKHKKLYNLLTDRDTFKIKNLLFKHYNSAIDNFAK